MNKDLRHCLDPIDVGREEVIERCAAHGPRRVDHGIRAAKRVTQEGIVRLQRAANSLHLLREVIVPRGCGADGSDDAIPSRA